MAGPSSELDAAPAPPAAAPPDDGGRRPGRLGRLPTGPLLAGAVVLTLAVSVALRLWPRSALWLDEAQSVAIARRPLLDIPGELRIDGAPPLFYLILHLWMEVFGGSTPAVRALPILFSLAGLVVIGMAARRYGGPRAVWPAVLLLATNPFAIRYATETRMYSLVVLEVAVGLIVLPWALDRPTWRRLAAVALLTAALLYTHYWSFYLLASVTLVLATTLLVCFRAPLGRASSRVLGAMAVGGLLWLPWLPTFLFQAEHTATPWTARPTWDNVVEVLPALAGGSRPQSIGTDVGVLPLVTLVVLLTSLVVFALLVEADPPRTRLNLRTYPPARGLVAVAIFCPSFAVLGARYSGSAFVSRYMSIVVPVIVVLAAVGLAHVGARWARYGLLGLACLAAMPLAIDEAGTARTPATTLANQLEAGARPDDVVVYCPDQLGPAVARRLEGTVAGNLQQGTFPDWGSPERVDWIDYRTRHHRASAVAFADDAVRRAGTGAVWLVWSPLYPPTQESCVVLRAALGALRPGGQLLVKDRPGAYLDHGALLRYPAEPADQLPVR